MRQKGIVKSKLSVCLDRDIVSGIHKIQSDRILKTDKSVSLSEILNEMARIGIKLIHKKSKKIG